MSFVNPIWLWGLFALLIPFLIHLWSKQKTNVLPFGSIRFLQESSSSQSRSVQLTDVLLMLLRMIILTLLVFILAQWLLPEKLERTNWLILGEDVQLPKAFNTEQFEVHKISDLTDRKYLNQWYFLQELSQQHPEIDSLVWIDQFNATDFWGAIPSLSFSYELINRSDNSVGNQLISETDTAFYEVVNLEKQHQVLVNNILKTNTLYTESKLVFIDSTKQKVDMVFSNEVQKHISLQFVFTDKISQFYSVEHNWPEKIVYISDEYLEDARLYDQLLLIISEQLAQWKQPVWNYNSFEQATAIRKDQIDKSLKYRDLSKSNEVLFWVIIFLIVLERGWVYRKANA